MLVVKSMVLTFSQREGQILTAILDQRDIEVVKAKLRELARVRTCPQVRSDRTARPWYLKVDALETCETAGFQQTSAYLLLLLLVFMLNS